MSIKTEHLTHIFGKGTAFEKLALDNVTIDIEKGNFVGIIGHTGSGKSTLIQHFNRLLAPTSGKVFFGELDINLDKSKLKSIREKVGLVFQYPEHQLFEDTVYKDVAFGPKNMGIAEQEIRDLVLEALSLVGLDKDICEKSPFDLSGGQKRRVAIAGILAMKPEVLILDEPTAGLDPKGRNEILEQINFLHKKTGNTIVLVSHSMEDIARLATKIIVLHDGKVKYNDTPKEVFVHVKELEDIGLAVPQVSYLMSELNKAGVGVRRDIYTVDEAVDEIYKLYSS